VRARLDPIPISVSVDRSPRRVLTRVNDAVGDDNPPLWTARSLPRDQRGFDGVLIGQWTALGGIDEMVNGDRTDGER